MKAAEMIYDSNNKPMWDKMWSSYCNLAAEGGPSHRDTENRLTFPKNNFVPSNEIKNEIQRGLDLLEAKVYKITNAGEIFIDLKFRNKAKWFSEIINTENVEAKYTDKYLILPWSGDYRIENEIKSILTVWGKALHYWTEHRPLQFKIYIILFGKDPLIRK